MNSTSLNELFSYVLNATASDLLQYLRLNPAISLDFSNEKGDTALMLAARRGDIEIVKILLNILILFLE